MWSAVRYEMWLYYYPNCRRSFQISLRTVSLEAFHRAINKVEPSLIRTEADEVTYNLHVMIRFDLELALLEGRLAVKDLPEAWHARYERIWVARAQGCDGVLQDIHWFWGVVGGAFQGYTLGNIMAGAFYETALQARSATYRSRSRAPIFARLHEWLRENIYQHGRKFTPDELVQRVTGGPLTIEPYMRYLRRK